MVREYGMSRLGRIYLSAADAAFLRRRHGEARGAQRADRPRGRPGSPGDHRRTAWTRCGRSSTDGRNALDAVAHRLIEKEVLEDRELLELLEKSGFPISAAARKNLLEQPNAHQPPMVDQITTRVDSD